MTVGGIEDLRKAAATEGLEYASVRASPQASWGRVLEALCALEEAGFEQTFPYVD